MIKLETASHVCSLLCSAFPWWWWGGCCSILCVTMSPPLLSHCVNGIGPQRQERALSTWKWITVTICFCWYNFFPCDRVKDTEPNSIFTMSLTNCNCVRYGSHRPSFLTHTKEKRKKQTIFSACMQFCYETFLISFNLFVFHARSFFY